MAEESSSEEGGSQEQQRPGKKPIKKNRKSTTKKTHKMISSTYQTKKCDFYNRGSCNKGDQCTFSHNFIPDVAKKICKFFLSNSCSKGSACPYSHDTKRYPCKFFHIQKSCLQGQECRFSHGPIEPDFQQEFLKDNEDFLIKLVKQEWRLPQKYADYVAKNDLMNQDRREQNDDNANKPFIFELSPHTPVKKQKIVEPQKAAKIQIRDPRLKPIQKQKQKQQNNAPVNIDPRLRNREIANNAKKLQVFQKKNVKVQGQDKNITFFNQNERFYICLQQYMRSFY